MQPVSPDMHSIIRNHGAVPNSKTCGVQVREEAHVVMYQRYPELAPVGFDTIYNARRAIKVLRPQAHCVSALRFQACKRLQWY